MKIYIVEREINKEVEEIFDKHFIIDRISDLKKCNVVIISKVKDIKKSINIVETALQNGIEIICIKPVFCKEGFLCNLLIKEGAIWL